MQLDRGGGGDVAEVHKGLVGWAKEEAIADVVAAVEHADWLDLHTARNSDRRQLL